MKQATNGEFHISQAIYRRLLRAYPRPHREAYGAAMEQLFRDQCREAWNASRYWGLFKLWFRVLPDLLGTSILERLTALQQRKTRPQRLANLFSWSVEPAEVFRRVFVPVFVLVFGASVVITFLLPKSYASTSQLLVRWEEGPELIGARTNSASAKRQMVQEQVNIIKSDAVLSNAVATLNLNQIWSKKYFNGGTLQLGEAINLLRNRLDLSFKTQAINITVFDDDPNEAAAIANAVVNSYRTFQISLDRAHDEEMSGPANAARQTLGHLYAKNKELSQRVATLKEQYHISNEATGPQSSEEQPYWDAKRDLLALRAFLNESNYKYNQLMMELDKARVAEALLGPSRISNISEIQHAAPNKVPARPDKPVNIGLGAFIGVLIAAIVGGVAALLRSFFGKRLQKTSVTA